ncbi:exocyst complex component 1-like isoform X2 [Scleropages formosus]|uniref:Exocyst complex component 1-like n=1 Tax=Scleropages formosus TaxID=113540 RepID=A0A8C9V226_SCLFO|nr:exocyst complex component 1-like isoform X2 [Scleropages formosus]
MAVFSLRSTLQREIFTPREERLLGISFVWKASRKRKSAILCAAVSSEQQTPSRVVLVTVKTVKGHYKLSDSWPANDLTVVDGKDAVKETAEFDLHLDKVYRWVSSSAREKGAFVTCLWKINQRYLQDKVKFINISPAILEEVFPWQPGGATEIRGLQEVEEDGFQELTEREAADVQRLMEQSDTAVCDAKAFSQALHTNLARLDQDNLEALMETECQGERLLSLLDEALVEVERIERVLSRYDGMLFSAQRQLDVLQTLSDWLQNIDRNHGKLRSELCHLVEGLSLGEDHMRVLTEGDLKDEEQVEASILAVQMLSRCYSMPTTAGQRRLHGVAEQLIRFENVRQTFEQRLCQHITNILQGLGNGESGTETECWDTPLFHSHLLSYKPLMDWLRESSPLVFQQLAKVYAENISQLYERQTKELFESARSQLSGAKEPKKAGFLDSVASASSSKCGVSGWSSPPSGVESRASRVIEQVLGQLEFTCIREQEFLVSFFSLDSVPESAAVHMGRRSSVIDQTQTPVNPEQKKRPHSWIRTSSSVTHLVPCVGEWDCVRAVLGPMEHRLCALLSSCEKAEPLSCLTVLRSARRGLCQYRGHPCASLYCSLLQCAQEHGQHNLRTYTESLCREMEHLQVTKKSRGGILPFVSRLEEFLSQGKAILGGEEGHWGLEASYLQLFKAAIHTLDKLNGQNGRSSLLVTVMMNFHRMRGFLKQVELPGLKEIEDELRQRMALQLQHYVANCMGRPLGALTDFMEGVRGCLMHGVREEEVCFQLAYSKQELRRVTERYPGREVRRALEAAHKRANRDLVENPELLKELWTTMQTSLLSEYHQFQSLISKCYAGAGISLDFTEQDLLHFFSAISKDSRT